MRRVANGHPSALVIERCQPGSRFTWWGVPVRGKIPADCIHTHTHAQFPLRSAFDQTHKPLLLYSSSVCFFLSLSVFLTCPLPLARVPDFTLSVLLAVLCLSPYIIFSFTNPPSLCFSFFFSSTSLSLSLSTVVVLVELCIFVLCQCFKSHQSDGISGLSPQLCTIISFCPIQHISELSGPSGNISKNN